MGAGVRVDTAGLAQPARTHDEVEVDSAGVIGRHE